MKPCRLLLPLLLAGLLLSLPTASAQRIGQWTPYLSYNKILHVEDAQTRVYAATDKGLFYYDTEDLTVTPVAKGSGLSDIGISTIAYDRQSRSLFVAYNNGNLDILQNDATFNVSGIKQWVYSGDKSIHSIAFDGKKAYLACGFGLVVVNISRKEIEDTYYFSDDFAANCAVYDVAFTDSLIYISTSKGLLHAPKGSQVLNIESTWTADAAAPWDTAMPQRLAVVGNRLAVTAMTTDPTILTLYLETDEGYAKVTRGAISSVRVCDTIMVVAMWDSVAMYSPNGSHLQTVSQFIYGDILAHDVIRTKDGRLWIGHDWAGMVVVSDDGSTFTTAPDGPMSDNVYRIRPITGGVAVCPGGKSGVNASLYIDGNIYIYKNHTWGQLDKSGTTEWIHDIVDVAENPNDNHILAAGSWGRGLVEIKDNAVQTIYDTANSDGALDAYVSGNFSTLRIGSVAYDYNGTLWMLNAMSDNGLVAHYYDGTWEAFNTARVVNGALTNNLVFDTLTGYLWFSGRNNRIFVHNGGDLIAWVDPNQGSRLQTGQVNCMVQDQNGHIWIGTDKGIKVIYDGYKAFDNGGNGELSPVSCSNILFSEGELVEYLLAYESITAIAVDGANRKWIGTAAGGLYLLSSTGLEQIENFTVENSPLFSNKIVAVGIHPITGEVLVGTDMGLQSYRSTATYAEAEPEKKIHVFPNPVRPEYDGPVAMRGFTRNAIVHITDEAGHVVYSTRADGGQAIWYIRNNSGVRVSSGVYFVFASDEEGHNKSVGKILVIK
jgi:ligand-binding sensor domain-containing protein